MAAMVSFIEQENQDPNNQRSGEIPHYFRSAKKRRSIELMDKSEAKKRRDHDIMVRTVLREQSEVTVSKPKDWKSRSVKHRQKFERLLDVWENESHKMRIIKDNGVCFDGEFLIGCGSCGTAVYICLGCDGIERAIKVLPKHLFQNLLNNERDILNSWNAIESPRIVNYWNSGEDISGHDSCYLILNLYEQNLEEYVKENGEEITEPRAREMIRQMLEGLKAIHGNKPRILHRDLKPSNILVDVKGNLALSDFGIGRIMQGQILV